MLGDDDKNKNPVSETDPVVEKTSAASSAAMPAAPTPKLPRHQKKWFKPALFGLALVALFGATFVATTLIKKHQESKQEKSITIGETVITESDINNYAQKIENYKKASPNADFQGEPRQVAVDDLVLNAALKYEAKNLNSELKPEELDKLMNKTFPNDQERKMFYESQKLTDAGLLNVTKAENEALERKLRDQLLLRKSVFAVSISFDTPYFNSKKPEDVQKALQAARDRLNGEFKPLFDKKQSKEDIAKKADVNLMDNNKTDDSNYQQYFDKLVTTAEYYPVYLSGQTPFSELDQDEWAGVKIDNIQSAATVIDNLRKKGDYSDVIATKLGRQTIFRIEDETGGRFNSWTDFLKSYKEQYQVDGTFLAYNGITRTISQVGNQIILGVSSIGLQKAQAQAPPGGCASHNVTFRSRSFDQSIFWFKNRRYDLYLESFRASLWFSMDRHEDHYYASG